MNFPYPPIPLLDPVLREAGFQHRIAIRDDIFFAPPASLNPDQGCQHSGDECGNNGELCQNDQDHDNDGDEATMGNNRVDGEPVEEENGPEGEERLLIRPEVMRHVHFASQH